LPIFDAETVPKSVAVSSQGTLFPQMKLEELELLKSQDRVVVFCRGFCVFTYQRDDRFSRNYCIVQLHLAGGIKLKSLSEVFEMNYQHCSKILARFKNMGVDGLREETAKRFGNRELIDDQVGSFILSERKIGAGYEAISEKIRFSFKKKIKAESLRAWVYRNAKIPRELACIWQMEMEVGQEIYQGEELQGQWHRNIYAGSMILYALIQRIGFLRPFEECLKEDFGKRNTSSGVRRVVLTLFFLHALRCKNIEQSKHLVGKDFCQIVGGGFLRSQSLRYAIDEIVQAEGFDQAIEAYYRDLITLTEKGDRIYYTDGHFSTYYGKYNVPMGWDPRRQMGHRGRNTIYLHNSAGENIYLFESAANTSLGNDIERLVIDIEKLGMALKRKTLIFDRGGYSKKCFSFLKLKKMYFATYLKNRKKEREIPINKFESHNYKSKNGQEFSYLIFEKERRWVRNVLVRVIVFIGTGGRQIPILTSNPFLNPATIIFHLQRRWREENSFKFMIEHFAIDLLTTYKTESAPDKIIKRANPERKAINQAIAKKKNELAKLQGELAVRAASSKTETMKEFFEQENELSFSIKMVQVEIDMLTAQRERIAPQIQVNLQDENVIMAQKRRLFINAIKAMNYNVEKWLQIKFENYHSKTDEVLSLIRSLWRQPGRVREDRRLVEVELEPPDGGAIRESVRQFLEELSQNKGLRMADGRLLRIKMMR
jgi:hypothetical protein